jgi:hypothetical protein
MFAKGDIFSLDNLGECSGLIVDRKILIDFVN